MKLFSTNLNNNPLKVTLLFSALLHATGFYILSSISFNLISRSPDVIPIKVTALVEKKEIQAVNVKHVPQQNARQSTHSPKLVSTKFNKVFASKPTPIYNKNNRPQPSKVILQAKLPKDIAQLKLASSNSPSPSLIEHQRFFTKEISTATPKPNHKNQLKLASSNSSSPSLIEHQRFFTKDISTAALKPNHKNQLSHQNTDISATPTKFIETLSKPALLDNPRAHISSKIQVDDSKNFDPVPLHQGSVKKSRFIPNVRNFSLAHGFTEESLDSSQSKTVGKTALPSKNFSSFNLGELRRGFHGKIWQRVAKVKYYPRMARKRGLEGKPIVAFTLGKKGELVNLKLIEASSYDLLNEAALETIRRGIPYPPIPEPLGKNSISFNLPISYVLEE